VCSSLRDTFGETLPIFFVSGTRTEPLDSVAGLLVGADDYIVKPFVPEELIARVRRALTRTNELNSANGSSAGALTPASARY
jgi:two-component system, OmpR family, response regulator VanR